MCFPCLRLPLPSACFPAPYPPDPLPLWGRGRFIVILCKGLRPLHPRGLNPGGTGGRGRTTCSVGGVLSLSPVATAFNWFSCPLFPRPPSPAGKGEIFSLFCRGLRPRHPGLNLRGAGSSCGGDCLRCCLLWNQHKRRPNNRFIREKFWGGLGDSFKSPPAFPPFPPLPSLLLRVAFPLEPGTNAVSTTDLFEKNSGGSGGLFQESPSVSPAFPRFPRFRDSQGLFLENILLF